MHAVLTRMRGLVVFYLLMSLLMPRYAISATYLNTVAQSGLGRLHIACDGIAKLLDAVLSHKMLCVNVVAGGESSKNCQLCWLPAECIPHRHRSNHIGGSSSHTWASCPDWRSTHS